MLVSIRSSAFFFFLALVESEILHRNNNNTNLDGTFRVTYDDAVSDNCESLVMIGVGTNMNTEDYDILSSKVSTGKPIVTVFTDHQDGWSFKLDEKKYASLYNRITQDLDIAIPVCKGKSPTVIIGGHSASGRAGLQAMKLDLLSSPPDGFIGLDPFQAQKERTFFPRWVPGTTIDPDLPFLSWGFERTTCSVNVEIAAKSAYELAGKENRVFFRVANTGQTSGFGHCEFSDWGCKVIGNFSIPSSLSDCPDPKNDNVKDVVAESIQVFAAAVSKGSINAGDFKLDTSNAGVGIEVFVNSDDVSNFVNSDDESKSPEL